jgi:hypothetical protein
MLVIIPASSCPSYLEDAKALAKTFLHGNSRIVALTVHTILMSFLPRLQETTVILCLLVKFQGS